jgi:DNA modification methylase
VERAAAASCCASPLQAYGAGRSIVVDRTGVVIAGNKALAMATELGVATTIVPSDGNTLVVVQRTDLELATDPRARGLAIADNRVGELDLEWNPEVLAQLHADGLDTSTWWTAAEWSRVVEASREPIEEEVLAPAPTTITTGELWALGPHRLLCGDATEPKDVARLLGDCAPVLMATDPPYGVAYDPGWRHRAYPRQRTAVGDVRGDTVAAWPAAFELFPGDVVYCWHAAREAVTVATTLQQSSFELRAQIIWVKQHFALSRGDYHWQHEPCWYAVREGASSHWRGDRTQSTVWSVPNLNAMGGDRTDENEPTGHATQKPVRLFEIPILNHTQSGDAVYDPFVGSGTAIIAAERTGRTAFAMDIDARYVQTTIRRWERLTGQQAARLEGSQDGGDHV